MKYHSTITIHVEIDAPDVQTARRVAEATKGKLALKVAGEEPILGRYAIRSFGEAVPGRMFRVDEAEAQIEPVGA